MARFYKFFKCVASKKVRNTAFTKRFPTDLFEQLLAITLSGVIFAIEKKAELDGKAFVVEQSVKFNLFSYQLASIFLNYFTLINLDYNL